MDLVREFARNHSEAAFTELVRRHLNLVYSVARRCTGSDSDAQDVTQAVFVILARKAPRLRARTVLTGWLYETTRYTAACLQRTNARRHAREQEAYMQSTLTAADTADAWSRLAPHLEAAMAQLGERDRTLLALRFYENKSGPEAAALLGIREAAAHKRTARALEKLRKFFSRRGVALSATAIAGAVSANSVQAAPAGLAAAIAAAALSGTTITTTAFIAATKAIAMTTLQKIAVTAALTVSVGVGIYQAKENAKARAEVRTLQQQQMPLVEQNQQLQREYNETTNQMAALRADIERLNKNKNELLKLRGEVTLLRRQKNEVSVLRNENNQLQATADTTVQQRNQCLNNLRQIDAAMQQFALENRLTATNIIMVDQILKYLPGNVLPVCPSGGTYTIGSLNEVPVCSIPDHALPADVASPAKEQVLGVIIQALIQDNNGVFPKAAMAEARESYKRDHNGQFPSGINEGTPVFIPYLKQLGPRLSEATEAYKQSHSGLMPTNAIELAPYIPSPM
jgi:RNA polymerase sigma factor (sigma-70 family)